MNKIFLFVFVSFLAACGEKMPETTAKTLSIAVEDSDGNAVYAIDCEGKTASKNVTVKEFFDICQEERNY